MSKKFDLHQWTGSVKSWSLVFIPHLSISLIYIVYLLIGASILQEIESDQYETSSTRKRFDPERERLFKKIIEKRGIFDLEEYTKYIYRHIRQYEEEMKKSLAFEETLPLNFSQSLFLISTTLMTIGSNEFVPKNKIGKLFLIIYSSFGIPLTLVFINDLSSMLKQSLIYSYLNCSKYFLYSRRFLFFRSVSEEELSRLRTSSARELTMLQLIFTLVLYLLIGTSFISSKSFSESLYLSFTSSFTIHRNPQMHQKKIFLSAMIYLFFGLAIVFLYIEALKQRIEIFLTNIEKKFSDNLLELTQQMGFHDLTTDDVSANSSSIPDTIFCPQRQLTRTASLDQSMTLRPVGIAEPLRRLSTGFIRAFKSNDIEDIKHFDKSVQVSTIIRRCGRCADAHLPLRPVRRLSAISTSSSSMTDNASSYEDDDVLDFPPPTLDRIRQRRATLVAKTIISQLATQPRSAAIDELMPPFAFPTNPSHRAIDSSPVSVKVSTPTPPDSPSRWKNREEFSKISNQISSLLTTSDDEKEFI